LKRIKVVNVTDLKLAKELEAMSRLTTVDNECKTMPYFSLEHFENSIRKGRLWVLIVNNRIAASVEVYKNSDPNEEFMEEVELFNIARDNAFLGRPYIHALLTHFDYRGNRYGEWLLKIVAKRLNRKVWMRGYIDNESSLITFPRAGMFIIGKCDMNFPETQKKERLRLIWGN